MSHSDASVVRSSKPEADAPGEVQAGLVQVGLEAALAGHAPALGADVGRPVLVDPLVGGDGARVWQHHRRGALRARLLRANKQPASVNFKTQNININNPNIHLNKYAIEGYFITFPIKPKGNLNQI